MAERTPLSLSQELAVMYGSLPQVEAVALGGSQAAGYASPNSDIDLYVYHRQELPVDVRAELVRACAEQMEINNQCQASSRNEPADRKCSPRERYR